MRGLVGDGREHPRERHAEPERHRGREQRGGEPRTAASASRTQPIERPGRVGGDRRPGERDQEGLQHDQRGGRQARAPRPRGRRRDPGGALRRSSRSPLRAPGPAAPARGAGASAPGRPCAPGGESRRRRTPWLQAGGRPDGKRVAFGLGSLILPPSRREAPLIVGVPKETAAGERRVALVPDAVKPLKAKGIELLVQAGAGEAAGFADEAYAQAGATLEPDVSGAVRARRPDREGAGPPRARGRRPRGGCSCARGRRWSARCARSTSPSWPRASRSAASPPSRSS